MNKKNGPSEQAQNMGNENVQKNPLEELIACIKALEERVQKLENAGKSNDTPVQIPERRNYNPDRLPIGGEPRGYAEFVHQPKEG